MANGAGFLVSQLMSGLQPTPFSSHVPAMSLSSYHASISPWKQAPPPGLELEPVTPSSVTLISPLTVRTFWTQVSETYLKALSRLPLPQQAFNVVTVADLSRKPIS